MPEGGGRGRFQKGDSRINRGGRPKKFRAILEELIGEGGEEAYRELKAIAKGEVSYTKLVREPAPHEDSASAAHIPTVEVFPDWKVRADVWKFLIEQLNGKAQSSLEVSGSIDHNHEHTISPETLAGMSTEQLLRIERNLEAIEAEFEVAEKGLDQVPALPAVTEPVSSVLTPTVQPSTVPSEVAPAPRLKFFKGT
jgi:hypothetical protein